MKFSELWLREWVNPAIDSTMLAEQITMSGLEVTSMYPVAGHFSGVVVGNVVQCKQHPNADNFYVTKIDIGGERLLNIVCGAPNCRANLRVAVAIIGALLPGVCTIKAKTLRGELSEGMLCSCSELGMSDDYSSSNIIEFPDDAPIGRDIRDYLQLNDNIIDISVTPNRADCLGLLGIARDVAVRNRIELTLPVVEPVVPLINDTLPIQIDTPEACPCYLARLIKSIDIGAATPLWMKEKLRRCGLRSVDAVLDITNYVLLELGQPIQVFDLDRIESGIFVRQAGQDEMITLLDDVSIILSSDTLVIADQNKVLAIAGIVVGAASSISSSTRDIVLTCAYFHPLAINGRARRYGLHNDASHRYERGVDPALQIQAMERATMLLIAICGGQPGPVINVTTASMLKQQVTISLRRKTLDRLIGYHISDKDVSDILIRLGFQVSSTEEGWQALTPSWRFDITIEEDLIEEVARMYGYDEIPNIPIRATLEMPRNREATLPLERVKMLLVDRGYQEAITYSFVDPKMQALLYPHPAPLLLPSPISKEMSAMRLSLWTGLLSAVVYNQNRQQQRIRLFESGLCFIPDKAADLGIRQDIMLAGVITGSIFDEHWDLVRQPVDFYDAKGDLEAILELTGKLDNIEFKAQRHLALHPGQSAAIYLQDELIGFIGVIHPVLESKLNLNGRTLVFELLWEKVTESNVPKAHDISRFPTNRRDIAVVVADNVAAADLITECKIVAANQLVDIKLFDVYRGKELAEGFKSLAISLVLQDTACTLEEAEIAATVAKCVAALKQRFQASLRD
ncbi:phenylalanine--tRNA ligase subunit beta [Candidatus Hoaglandella endobia]|uniref:Phenylalanine--tRNA ligase beta subunit n=1 Tax=Candidatus Hoaglandella endobia TaxID=1778263 RepID=A0A143WTT3_9ENTR|nr:phenylalanine--tRNA ligase subunit beta [Candidatus Hoaglandella endobia]CUX97160.1 Phenylalanine--tRNA ligase beta subunit [Candidatus Hoaglandella endobia]